MENGIMLQGFEWDLPADGQHWKRLTAATSALHRHGFTAIWLPPAYKGAGGGFDVGYGVYDMYDLGEFDQKGSIRTKYGTHDDYLKLIRRLHFSCMQALPDVVFNHRMGGDETEQVMVYEEDFDHRNCDDAPQRIAELNTRLTFPGRKKKYSSFEWDATCFTGTDWDNAQRKSGLFRIVGKRWAEDVDKEHSNYDFLMGLDVDVSAPHVKNELLSWGLWYVRTTKADGFRLDAVKHISAAFYADWLARIRKQTGREIYAVGEYWHYDVNILCRYLDRVGECMNLFDVPLHFHLKEAAENRFFDMSHMFDSTLTGCRPHVSVTFVDNHDTQPGQSLESWVPEWFKPAAYGLILLRAFGYPCVFWGDWAGIPSKGISRLLSIEKLIHLRCTHAWGEEHDYFDHCDLLGFTREGDERHPGSGLAFLCTNACGGTKRMYVGERFSGRTFLCAIGQSESVIIDKDGYGEFTVGEQQARVWVPAITFTEWAGRQTHMLTNSVKDHLRGAIWGITGHEP